MKEQKMCFVIIKEGNTTTFERIGDDLESELIDYAINRIREERFKNKHL